MKLLAYMTFSILAKNKIPMVFKKKKVYCTQYSLKRNLKMKRFDNALLTSIFLFFILFLHFFWISKTTNTGVRMNAPISFLDFSEKRKSFFGC